MGRYDIQHRIEGLDPARDFHEIYRLMTTYEFPWDMNQALSFALFRTYAVPSIGGLLARTGELVDRVQKRYDDTVIVLDAILEHGLTDGEGQAALRRMNQMHRAYDIGNDDMRYVLSTFVVTPIRWMDDFGWRRMTEHERVASANDYRALGRRMAIRDIPETWQDSPGSWTTTRARTSIRTAAAGGWRSRPSSCSPRFRRTTCSPGAGQPDVLRAHGRAAGGLRLPAAEPGLPGAGAQRAEGPRPPGAPPAAPARPALAARDAAGAQLPVRLRHRADRHVPAR